MLGGQGCLICNYQIIDSKLPNLLCVGKRITWALNFLLNVNINEIIYSTNKIDKPVEICPVLEIIFLW